MGLIVNADISKAVEKIFRESGFGLEKSTNRLGRIMRSRFTRQGVLIVDQIEIDPYLPVHNELDRYFDRLKAGILADGVNHIVFRGGGDLPIPEDFSNWCRNNNVAITVLEPWQFLELPHIVNRIIDEYRG